MRNWDLWGPLLLCLVLAIVLSRSAASKVTYDATGHAKDSQSAVVFASVFVIVWVGAAVISFNSRLLGARLLSPLLVRVRVRVHVRVRVRVL